MAKPIKFVNIGVNTDQNNIRVSEHDAKIKKSHSKLKERGDIQHIHITNSNALYETYNFGEVLGIGSFGKVLAINDKNEEKAWAMKIIPKTLIPIKMKALRNEIHILKLVSHPHIILLEKVFESNNRIYLMLEKCTGELGKLFKKTKPFSESDTRIILVQLAEVVDYLHKNDIVHRDLKLENILLAQNPQNSDDTLYIKVTDFGLSIVKGNEMLHDRCGTLVYLSPEIITTESYSQQCDIWAMGIIMYLLLHGKYPFYAPLEHNLIKLICYNEPQYQDNKLSDSAINLLRKMLLKDPARRITAAEVKSHSWIEGLALAECKSKNVFDMMKLWRSDMMLPQGDDSDWMTQEKSADGAYKQSPMLVRKDGKKQSLKIPIHNIEFDRKKRGSLQSQEDLKRRSTISKIAQVRQRSSIYGVKMDPSTTKQKNKCTNGGKN